MLLSPASEIGGKTVLMCWLEATHHPRIRTTTDGLAWDVLECDLGSLEAVVRTLRLDAIVLVSATAPPVVKAYAAIARAHQHVPQILHVKEPAGALRDLAEQFTRALQS